MVERTQHTEYDALKFQSARSTMRAHGILSIIFGGIGVLVGALFFAAIVSGAMNDPMSTDPEGDSIALAIAAVFTVVIWTIPHLYLIIAGFLLVRTPTPKLAKGLIITNLVVGVFWNLVLLILAIVNLTQLADYERGYHAVK